MEHEKKGRWSVQKKVDVVLRLLRGESLDAVSRESQVTVEALSSWREEFLVGGAAGLKGKTPDQVRIAALEKKVGQQAMELELHKKKRSSSAGEARIRERAAPGALERHRGTLPRAHGSCRGRALFGRMVHGAHGVRPPQSSRP